MKKHLILCAIVLCSTSLFAQDFKVDGIYYNFLGGDSVEVASCDHSQNYVTIPDTVSYNNNTYRITSIGEDAFRSHSNLFAITIPSNVITIGNGAFAGCYRLEYITINEGVKSIGDFAFDSCSSLTSITIPNSVTTIGDGAFFSCSNLSAPVYNAYVFAFLPTSYSGTYTIPEDITSIAGGAFYGCSNLTAVTIPNSVTTIGDNAFLGCSNLTEVTIGESVTTIGRDAFSGCYSLTEITISNSVTAIGEQAFFECSSLTQTNYTGDLASWCKIQFGNSLANPINYSHNLYINGESVTKIALPEGVTSIPMDAFAELTPLTEVTIPNSVTSIGSYAFGHCSNLTTVTIGTGLQNLGYGAFAACENLTKFICASSQAVEDNHNSMEDYEDGWSGVLLGLKHLDTIVAPAQFFDMTEVYWTYLTKNISYIQVSGGELTADAFGVINRSFDKLQTLDISAATNTEIANNAFKGCYKLETLLLPAQLERIGYMAVADCKNLQAIDIPATVTDIDDSAFENCRSMETLTFGGQQPASAPQSKVETPFMASPQVAQTSALQRIGNWAFYNCHELQHLEIPEGVTEIGAAAFYGCTYLEDLTLPTSVQSIGDNCFALCSKLQKITCLATVPPTIEAKTFYDVNRTIPLYVPEASINDYANDTYWGEFINTQAAEDTTDVETPFMCVSGNVRKVLENGQVVIIRDGVRYNMLGIRL